MARTFKPLWKLSGELKIRDVGEHMLLFEFEDNLDLERVLEYELGPMTRIWKLGKRLERRLGLWCKWQTRKMMAVAANFYESGLPWILQNP
nr:hypothetical protein CFP56_25631 [Quercus suber]